MKIVYVVLHYLATKDTIECVESILNNIKSEEHKTFVVVVDNGSPNNSYADLQEVLKDYVSVKLMKSEKNLGFTKGNNLGYEYAKYQIGADFIVLLNNDTMICQSDFSDMIVKKYEEKQYAVLGPDIVTADGYHQNPGIKQSWESKELRLFRLKKRIRVILSYLHLDQGVSKLLGQTKKGYRKERLTGDIENTVLHGSCLIFSPSYIENFEGLYDKTFLYWEEDILKSYADFYGFLMMYTSELQIYHKEDAATKQIPISDEKRVRLKYRRLIESSKRYSSLKRNMTIKRNMIKTIEIFAGNTKNNGTTPYPIDFNIPIIYLFYLVWQRGWMLIRGKICTIGMKSTGKIVFIGKKVIVKCKSKMILGTGVTIQDGVYIDALSKNGVYIGDGSSIGSHTIIRCSGNLRELGKGFHLGKRSSLADNCFVGATGGVFIGDDVIGGQNIRFHASNHIFKDRNKLIKEQGLTKKGIRIGNNCWIGAGAVFCDGVSIGSGCVIGANAVVTKSFPDNSIIVGNPARLIKIRGES